MRFSEFVRNVSEIDVALGRLRGFACTEEGCGGVWATCGRVGEEKARELLDRLRELGLPDLPAELGKIVGRQVTVDDICVFWGTNRLYERCVLPGASEERCRKEYRRALKEARERLENIPELKKRLENLLAKLDGVDRFRLEHSFPTGATGLWLPLAGCGALVLRYSLSSKDFEVVYYPPHEGPLAREPGAARELKAWFAEVVEGTLGGLGMNRYEATTDFDEVATRLPGLDPGAAFRLFGLFVDLVPLLDDVCAAFSMRWAAGKTPKRERVRV